MMRSAALAVVVVVVASGACVGCFSSTPGKNEPDASTGLDASVPEADAPAAEAAQDSTMPSVDAPAESSPVDSTLPDASDAGALDASDASSPVDASDGGTEASADAGAEAGAGTVTSMGTLHLGVTRQEHTATLLTSGHVLICGGYYGPQGSSASCDDFDPTTSTISAGPSMRVGRRDHSATLLPSGQVLVAGGAGTIDAGYFNVMRTAEIYDPTGGSFTLVSNLMVQARSGPAVLLTSGAGAGKVVLVGGSGDGTIDSGTANDDSHDSAEVVDPGADATQGTFTLLGVHLGARRGGSMTAAALPEGGLLAAGGSYGPGGGPYTILDTAETLDPALGAFTATTNRMSDKRQGAQSVVLPDGRVFVFDGYGASGNTAKADIYDPATRTFTATASLPTPRNFAALALLKSGRVMLAGGVDGTGTLGEVIVYDPTTNAFLPTTGALNPPRSMATATTLNDGRVLIAGGQTGQGFVTTAVDLFTE
jgi:hypothetical protein